jgi:hypothetical protein
MLVMRTQPAKKRKESEALASRIKRSGFEMFPCSNCERENKRCLVSDRENSGRYSEYVLQKASCNVEGILVSEWQSLKVEEERLQHESEAAMRAVCKNMSCLKRFKKQKKFLKSKGKDMVRRSLKTLDKLEEVEEKEKQMEEERAATRAAATVCALAPSKPDPFTRIEILLLLLKVWGDWDFASKTLQVS